MLDANVDYIQFLVLKDESDKKGILCFLIVCLVRIFLSLRSFHKNCVVPLIQNASKDQKIIVIQPKIPLLSDSPFAMET